MKQLIFSALALLSINAFSQTYMVLNNGVILTVDKAGFVYDFGHFILPYNVKSPGGSYLVEDNKLITVSEKGLLTKLDYKAKDLEVLGGNFYIDDNGTLFTINANGLVFKYKEDDFTRVEKFGGNYFTNYSDRKETDLHLITISNTGLVSNLQVPGLDPKEINHTGGNYFITKKNVLYTVSDAGIVVIQPQIKIGFVKKRAGNFFIDSNGFVYGVTAAGNVVQPTVPSTFNVGQVKQVGMNYMITTDGKIFVMTSEGQIYERSASVRHDMTQVKVTTFK
jgi:hypothetical protein